MDFRGGLPTSTQRTTDMSSKVELPGRNQLSGLMRSRVGHVTPKAHLGRHEALWNRLILTVMNVPYMARTVIYVPYMALSVIHVSYMALTVIHVPCMVRSHLRRHEAGHVPPNTVDYGPFIKSQLARTQLIFRPCAGHVTPKTHLGRHEARHGRAKCVR